MQQFIQLDLLGDF